MRFGSKETRSIVGEKVRKLRNGERNGILIDGETGERKIIYLENRDAYFYFECLKGYRYFLDYVRQLPKPVVLDIGAGTTKAIAEIAKSRIGKGLQFLATTLRRNPEIALNLGFKHTRITTIEVLRGVPSGSVGGIFSVFSLPYVVDPKLALESIDRVLCSGGVIKMHFPVREVQTQHAKKVGNNYHSYQIFLEELKKMGYDLAWDADKTLLSCVIVAVKPGNSSVANAEKLLSEDMSDYYKTVGYPQPSY